VEMRSAGIVEDVVRLSRCGRSPLGMSSNLAAPESRLVMVDDVLG
jgi:hypothetical protein